MKRVFFFCFLFLLFNKTNAQLIAPGATPTAKSEIVVGLTTITLDYSRPSKFGRKIFGGLVRYDTIWRTGANKNTKITFSDDVKIDGKKLKQGTYAIFSKPSQTLWEIYFYSEYNHWGENFGVPTNWDTTKIAAKVVVVPKVIPTVETFSINVENVDYQECTLEIKWDNLCIPIKIEVPTDEKMSQNIERFFSGPNEWDYYRAAIHNRRAKKDLKQALIWIDKAIEIGSFDLYFYRQKSLIEADMGDFKAALISANISLKMAKEEGDKEYIKLNRDAIEEWSKK